MSVKLLRFGINELKVIRITINKVVTELPIDAAVVHTFALDQVNNGRMSREEGQSLSEFVGRFVEVQKLVDKMRGIDFVLPDA